MLLTQYQKAMLSIVNESETKVFQQELLTVKIYPTLQQMGNEAAKEVADRICKLLEEKAEINMIFAAMTMSASLPVSREPFDESICKMRAGVSVIMRTASVRGTSGNEAAKEVADRICKLLEEKAEINMIFAAAPSQDEFLNHLIHDKRIDWTRINAFHMDE